MNRSDHETHEERRKQCPHSGWRRACYIIIFEADTPLGKLFDVCLLVAILGSIAVISLETVESLFSAYAPQFKALEWIFTVLFTVEYVLRVVCVRKPFRYIFSFWGLVDLFAILPSYVSSFGSFAMVRSIRLLRVFRVLKLIRLVSEAEELYRSVWDSREKIVVFLFTILIAVTLSGTLMYQVENYEQLSNGLPPQSSFDSIPQSMYWAIVTMTTVGYGDVVPQTAAGKAISAILILLGYSLIIVPTGFVTAKLSQSSGSANPKSLPERGPPQREARGCDECGRHGHPPDAKYCNQCGAKLAVDY